MVDVTCRKAGFAPEMVCQHLDDVVAAAGAGEREKLEKFEQVYSDLAALVGVVLAPKDDPDKAFSAARRGTVFGVTYDTEKWTWELPREKLERLLVQLFEAVEGADMSITELRSIVGKIVNIKALILDGKFYVGHIMRALAEGERAQLQGARRVRLDNRTRNQLAFWAGLLRTVSGAAAIPRLDPRLPAWARAVDTDAAGGALHPLGRGSGGTSEGWWFYYPWSKAVNSGSCKVNGKKVAGKMSALELIGPLIVLAAGAEWCSNSPVRIAIDNAGSVGIWKKGYCTACELSSTIVEAIAYVAASIGCRLEIVKVTRRSAAGPVIADDLSKAKFGAARQAARAAGKVLDLEPARIPRALLHWLEKPRPEEALGQRIVADLAARQHVL